MLEVAPASVFARVAAINCLNAPHSSGPRRQFRSYAVKGTARSAAGRPVLAEAAFGELTTISGGREKSSEAQLVVDPLEQGLRKETRGPPGTAADQSTVTQRVSQAGPDRRPPPPPARALRARRSKLLLGRTRSDGKSKVPSGRLRLPLRDRRRLQPRDRNERVQDHGVPKQGRDSGLCSRQHEGDMAELRRRRCVEPPDLAITDFDPADRVSDLTQSDRPCAPSLRRGGPARREPARAPPA